MGLVILIFAILCTYGAKISDQLALRADYMEKDQVNSLKGIFVLIIFISHSRGYMVLDGSLDALYNFVPVFLGQMMVIPFLFYSGYGVMESIKLKGDRYVSGIWNKRAGKVWIHFVFAVFLYCIVNAIFSFHYDWKTIFLAFLAWESIGNSQWFIFAIIVLYLLNWFVFTLIKKNHVLATLAMFLGTLILIFIFASWGGRPIHWYDTLIFYPIGTVYSLIKDKVDRVFVDKRIWLSGVVFFGITFFALKGFGREFFLMLSLDNFFFQEFIYLFFLMVFILFTMRVKIGNSLLEFCGKHVFSIYILQRIPFSIISAMGISDKYLVFFIGLICTLIFAVVFDILMEKFDRVFFEKSYIKS